MSIHFHEEAPQEPLLLLIDMTDLCNLQPNQYNLIDVIHFVCHQIRMCLYLQYYIKQKGTNVVRLICISVS